MSCSPIERFAATLPGCDGEPSIEKIADAATKVFRHPERNYSASTFNSGSIAGSWSSAGSSRSGGSGLSNGSGRSQGSVWSGRSSLSVGSSSARISKNYRTSRRIRPSAAVGSFNSYAPFPERQVAKHRVSGTRKESQLESFTGAPLSVGEINKALTEKSCPQVVLTIECKPCQHIMDISPWSSVKPTVLCSKCNEKLVEWKTVDFFGPDSLLKVRVKCGQCQEPGEGHLPLHVRGRDATTLTALAHEFQFECPSCEGTLFIASVSAGLHLYDCTFCPKKCQTKFGWERHETTIHQPQEVWICCSAMSYGPGIPCIFCNSLDSSPEHLGEYHRYHDCVARPVEDRTYGRKDQLAQHIRGFHRGLDVQKDMITNWRRRVIQSGQTWTCGICFAEFSLWSERLLHVGNHWNDGLDMRHWKTTSRPEKVATFESALSAELIPDLAQESENPELSRNQTLSQSHETSSEAVALPERTDNSNSSAGAESGRLARLASSLWGKVSFSGMGFTGT
jgi:hypothetical protein